MVHHCVAVKCSNEHSKEKQIPFHLFPLKRPAILELWKNAVRRENWYPSKTSKLCGAHFLPSDYQDKPGCTLKLLKADAVPSVFSFPQHLLKPSKSRRTIVKKQPNITASKAEHMDIDCPPSTSTAYVATSKDCGTQTLASSSVTALRRQIKTLKQKVRRRDLKLSSMKEVINEISKSGHSNTNLDAVLKNYFE
ncbi:hypothetical protein PPYR_12356, partial [Photinus pyralis]